MNTDTGQIYRGQVAIDAAIQRGEPVVPVSEHVARLMEASLRNLRLASPGPALEIQEIEERLTALEEKLRTGERFKRLEELGFVAPK